MGRLFTLRDEDFHAWTQEQATALRQAAESRINLPVDWEHLAEEVEEMGGQLRTEIVSALARIIEHLLNLEHSNAADPRRGWVNSVLEHRDRIALLLEDSPSLQRHMDDLLVRGWKHGHKYALRGLARDGIGDKQLPELCPYRLDEVLDDGWWPENRHGLPPVEAIS